MPDDITKLKIRIDELEKLIHTLLIGDRVRLPTKVELNSDVGTQIGLTAREKAGFYGVSPIVQRSGASQAAVATTGSTNITPFGYTTAAQANAIITLVNEIRAWAVAQGFIKGSS